jgi:hypothetical protein
MARASEPFLFASQTVKQSHDLLTCISLTPSTISGSSYLGSKFGGFSLQLMLARSLPNGWQSEEPAEGKR